MEHPPLTSMFDLDAAAMLQAELASAARDPALWPWVLDPKPDLGRCFVGHWRRLCALPRRTRRSLQRRWRRSLAAIALLMALGQVPALAATIPVDGTSCTLVDAIRAANTDVASGGCIAGSGADTLELVAGSTHTLTTIADTTVGPTGLPLVVSNITIAGNGGIIERGAGAPPFRLLAVSSAGIVNLQDVTLRGGYAFDGSVLRGPSRNGGGVANYGGTLTLTNSMVTGNRAGGFVDFEHNYTVGSGGGVFNAGTLIVSHSTIANNVAITEPFGDSASGGGLWNTGIATLTDSSISGNVATGYGGLGGSAGNGGGIATTGSLIVSRSTIADNGAGGHSSGGGIHGGGSSSTITLTNSTVSGNIATYGGGISARTFTLTNSTVSGNRGFAGFLDGAGGVDSSFFNSSLTLTRSIISGNTGPVAEVDTTGGTLVANAFNVFGTNGDPGVSGFSPGATDIVPGGPLPVDAVERGCPPPGTDQRGFARPADGDGDGTAACDVGAFELAARPLPICETAEPTRGCTVNGVAHQLCIGTAGDDEILGTPRDDIIFGLNANDRINGLGGNDLLCGGKGHDLLRGKQGRDRVFGGPGNDALQGGSGDDELFGEANKDELFGDRGDDALDGGDGPDTCRGDANGPAGDTAIHCETVFGVP